MGRNQAPEPRWINRTVVGFILGAHVLAGCGSVEMNPPGHLDGFSHFAVEREGAIPCHENGLEARDRCIATRCDPPTGQTRECCVQVCDREAIGLRNYCVLREIAAREWKSGPIRTDLRPRVALALSGGGMRSASFSIGVLSGLNEIDAKPGLNAIHELDRVDLISAVSGGAFALSWYYLQNYYSRDPAFSAHYDCKDCSSEILKQNGLYQNHLADHGAMMGYTRGIGNAIVSIGLGSPVNLLVNGAFGWHENTVPARRTYEEQIEATYHRTVPCVCARSNKNPWLPLLSMGVRDEVTLGDLGYFARQNQMPYFIINAAAYVDEDSQHLGALRSNTNVEFAGDHIGSDGFGYIRWDSSLPNRDDSNKRRGRFRETKVSRAVAISGAAVDGAVLVAGGSQKMLYSALNLDTGYYFDNYNPIPTTWQKWQHRAMPFPLYFAHHYLKDRDGVAIYLSDGGHTENLGAFAAIRRLPQELIIVDAEQDYDPNKGTYKFDGYFILKAALRREMGVDLYVPAIEKELLGRNAYNTDRSCVSGRIGEFPLYDPETGQTTSETIAVKYIKLSLNARKLSRYPATVQKYRRKRADVRCGGPLGKCAFPQQSTSDQSFSEEQFRAYRDLGFWIVKEQYAACCN